MYEPNSIRGMMQLRSDAQEESDKSNEDLLKQMDESLAKIQAWKEKNT
jgi:hypothetical protein